jgi:hypothetical protein
MPHLVYAVSTVFRSVNFSGSSSACSAEFQNTFQATDWSGFPYAFDHLYFKFNFRQVNYPVGLRVGSEVIYPVTTRKGPQAIRSLPRIWRRPIWKASALILHPFIKTLTVFKLKAGGRSSGRSQNSRNIIELGNSSYVTDIKTNIPSKHNTAVDSYQQQGNKYQIDLLTKWLITSVTT